MARTRCLSFFACFLLFRGIAAGQLPSGLEFRVNTFTSGETLTPQVAMDPVTGVFAIVWNAVPNCFGKRFSATGAQIGDEFTANGGCNAGATVTMLPPGGFVAVGGHNSLGNGSILGLRYDASGSLKPPFLVNTFTLGTKGQIDIASDANGNFVVVWANTVQDGSGYGIFQRRFIYSGEPVLFAPEFRVNQGTTGDQRGPVVARAPDGRFVMAWQSAPIPAASCCAEIKVRMFDAGGSALATEFFVAGKDIGGNYFPDVAIDTPGNFVVVWTNYNIYGNYSYNVFAQRYSPIGALRSGAFRVNATTAGIAGRPRVALTDSGFVVVWQEQQADGSNYAVLGRRFAASGSPIASIFRVNTFTTRSQSMAAIAARPGGAFVVAWASVQDPAALNDVYAQRFCINGDVNQDGSVTVADILYFINFLFAGGPPPLGCADADGNTSVNVSDILFLINYLFAGGPAPA